MEYEGCIGATRDHKKFAMKQSWCIVQLCREETCAEKVKTRVETQLHGSLCDFLQAHVHVSHHLVLSQNTDFLRQFPKSPL